MTTSVKGALLLLAAGMVGCVVTPIPIPGTPDHGSPVEAHDGLRSIEIGTPPPVNGDSRRADAGQSGWGDGQDGLRDGRVSDARIDGEAGAPLLDGAADAKTDGLTQKDGATDAKKDGTTDATKKDGP